MKKNTPFILLIVLSAIGSARIFWQPSKVPETALAGNVSRSEAASPASQGMAQEKNGIEITITSIMQSDDTTILRLVLDNHRLDLTQDAIYDQATLNGKPSRSHAFLSNASGGHHAEAEIMFEKTVSGSFLIAPETGTEFVFDNLW